MYVFHSFYNVLYRHLTDFCLVGEDGLTFRYSVEKWVHGCGDVGGWGFGDGGQVNVCFGCDGGVCVRRVSWFVWA